MAQQDDIHDLIDFIRQVTAEMSYEYARIQRRTHEDPGTAGDQGEENWATLLRDWLPSTYEVVTKGRIIGEGGGISPQVDVIVLKDVYPRKLLEKKSALSTGISGDVRPASSISRCPHGGPALRLRGDLGHLLVRSAKPSRHPERRGPQARPVRQPV